jgi:hypothetical protein
MSDQKILTEDDVIDYIFRVLYSNLDKNELHLEKQILASLPVALTDHQVEHIRELLMASGFINCSIGFGKWGMIYLNQQGIRFMREYKGYLSEKNLKKLTEIKKMR